MDELPGPGTVLVWCVALCWVTRLNFAPPVITFSLFVSWIVPVWTATTVCTYFRFLQVLFGYIGVIAYVFCHAGVLVCLFVVNVADFWYDVIEHRLSNSKLHYEFIVPHFRLLSFAWGPSISFQSHFLLQLLFCLLIPIWNLFVSVVILIGFFCLSEWYNRLCENWAGVRWHN